MCACGVFLVVLVLWCFGAVVSGVFVGGACFVDLFGRIAIFLFVLCFFFVFVFDVAFVSGSINSSVDDILRIVLKSNLFCALYYRTGVCAVLYWHAEQNTRPNETWRSCSMLR